KMGAAALVHAESLKAICRHAVGSGEDASDSPLNIFQVAFVGVKKVSAVVPWHHTHAIRRAKRTRPPVLLFCGLEFILSGECPFRVTINHSSCPRVPTTFVPDISSGGS